MIRTVPPTLQELLDLRGEYQSYHGRRLTQHRADESFFALKYFVPAPGGREPLIAPTGNQLVQEMINHVIAETPTVMVMPRTQSDKSQKQSGNLTSWVNGYWYRRQITKFMRRVLWHDIVRGCHVVRLFYNAGAWPAKPIPPVLPIEPANVVDGPQQQFLEYMAELATYEDDQAQYEDDLQAWNDIAEESLPIETQAVDPMFAFWEPAETPQKIILCWDRTIADILQRFPDVAEWADGLPSYSKVQWCEYWDRNYYAYWIEGYGSKGKGGAAPYWVVEPTKHEYGFFPFAIDGPWETPMAEAEDRFPSIYYAVKSVIQYESTLITQVAHLIRANGWAPIIITSDRANSDEQKPIIDMTPGRVNYLLADEEAKYFEYGGATLASLERLISFIGNYIDEGSGLSDIMRGQAKGRSGYQQAQIASAARVSLIPIEQCSARMLEFATTGALKLVRRVGEKVTVIGPQSTRDSETTVGPKDVMGHGQIKIQIRSILPIDDAAKIANIERMQHNGWIPPVEAGRLASVENPEEMHAAAEAYSLLNEPAIRRLRALKWLKEHDPDAYALAIESDQQQAMAQQQAPPGAPPGMAPPIPPGMGGPQNAGQPSPNPSNPPGQPAPGGAQEAALVQRQARQGGTSPKRLPK